MKIAVISDTHDNIPNLKKTLELCKTHGVEEIIHCGDLCSPFMILRMGEIFNLPIHVVFGNNDADRIHMMQFVFEKYKNIQLHGERAELEISGRKIFVTHYPVYAQHASETGRFDYVFFGHTHKAKQEKINQSGQIGSTLLLNPGEVAGVFSSPGFALIDLESGEIEEIQI